MSPVIRNPASELKRKHGANFSTDINGKTQLFQIEKDEDGKNVVMPIMKHPCDARELLKSPHYDVFTTEEQAVDFLDELSNGESSDKDESDDDDSDEE